jgi:hypothetical protein
MDQPRFCTKSLPQQPAANATRQFDIRGNCKIEQLELTTGGVGVGAVILRRPDRNPRASDQLRCPSRSRVVSAQTPNSLLHRWIRIHCFYHLVHAIATLVRSDDPHVMQSARVETSPQGKDIVPVVRGVARSHRFLVPQPDDRDVQPVRVATALQPSTYVIRCRRDIRVRRVRAHPKPPRPCPRQPVKRNVGVPLGRLLHQAPFIASVAVHLSRRAHVTTFAAICRLVVGADFHLQHLETRTEVRLEHPVQDLRPLRFLVRKQEG